MGWMLGQFQINPVIGAEKAQRQVAKPIRRGNGPPQDLTGFFFHRNAVLGGADSKPIQEIIIKFTHAQVGQCGLPRCFLQTSFECYQVQAMPSIAFIAGYTHGLILNPGAYWIGMAG